MKFITEDKNWDVEDIKIEDIDYKDAPDFCDAFIASATINGHDATDEELDELNDDSEFVFACVEKYLY